MLVLLSFVLVLVATVLLVLGLLVSDDGITLIYFSIGMSAVAAALLVVAVRKSKPAVVTAGGPSLLEPEPASAFVEAPERELATVGAPTQTLPSVAPAPTYEPPAAPAPEPVAEPAPAEPTEWLASDTEWEGESGAGWDTGADELEFPIADYDDLALDEVLPLLPQLYSDELDVVEARERQGLNRREVLDRLAELRISGTEADASLGADAGEAAPAVAAWEPEVESTPAGAGPLPGYDSMAVSEIVGALVDLDDAELDAVRAHEAATKNRRTVLAAIDRRLGVPAAAPAPAPAPAAVKRAPARKAAPATKAAPARKAAPVTKKAAAPATKAAPAKKAAPTRTAAPAKKAAPARKAAPVTKKAAPARKAAPVTKKAAPVKKAAPAKKAPAKKVAAPAKKAAKKR